MTSRDNLVSVIIPAFNAASFLPHAVASIDRQGYYPLEIIVVDDGSTDNTAEVARSLPSISRYLHQQNQGPSAARNLGLRHAGGEFIAFLDADDQWPPGKLDLQVGRLRAEPQLDIVLGRIQYISLPGAEEIDIAFETEERTLTHVHLGSGVYRRAVFERVGLFEETLRYSEDVDWFMRAREKDISMVILGDVTLLYQLHAGNMTREMTSERSNLAAVMRLSLERRRRRSAGQATELKPWSHYDETGRSRVRPSVLPGKTAE
ncbi:MAG: glycosyltransferase family A protein [Terriglobales bacterium]